MVLVLVGGVAEVHDLHVGVLQRALVPFLRRGQTHCEATGNWTPWRSGVNTEHSYHVRVVNHVVVGVDEEDVLRLQVGVGQLVLVQN